MFSGFRICSDSGGKKCSHSRETRPSGIAFKTHAHTHTHAPFCFALSKKLENERYPLQEKTKSNHAHVVTYGAYVSRLQNRMFPKWRLRCMYSMYSFFVGQMNWATRISNVLRCSLYYAAISQSARISTFSMRFLCILPKPSIVATTLPTWHFSSREGPSAADAF